MKTKGLAGVMVLTWLVLALVISGAALAADGTQRWKYLLGGDGRSAPAIGADGTIYMGSSDGYLYAFTSGASSATQKWKYLVHNDQSHPAIGTDGTIYICSYNDNYLYALTPGANSATLKWRYLTAYGSDACPAIGGDGTIYLGSYEKFYALTPGASSATQKWLFTGTNYENFHWTSPAIGKDGTVYITSTSGVPESAYLCAFNPTNGALKWKWGQSLNSSLAIGADGTIYVGSNNGHLYALTPGASSATVKWTYTNGSYTVTASPSIGVDGTIYIVCGFDLHAINPLDGTLKWKYTFASGLYTAPAIGKDGTVYVAPAVGSLYALTPGASSATKKWNLPTGTTQCSPAIGADGTIYIGSDDDYLYAFNGNSGGLADTPWPMFQQNVKHTGRAPLKPSPAPTFMLLMDE